MAEPKKKGSLDGVQSSNEPELLMVEQWGCDSSCTHRSHIYLAF